MLDTYYDENVVNKIKNQYITDLKQGKKPKSYGVSKNEYMQILKAIKCGEKMTVQFNGGTTSIPYHLVR